MRMSGPSTRPRKAISDPATTRAISPAIGNARDRYQRMGLPEISRGTTARLTIAASMAVLEPVTQDARNESAAQQTKAAAIALERDVAASASGRPTQNALNEPDAFPSARAPLARARSGQLPMLMKRKSTNPW